MGTTEVEAALRRGPGFGAARHWRLRQALPPAPGNSSVYALMWCFIIAPAWPWRLWQALPPTPGTSSVCAFMWCLRKAPAWPWRLQQALPPVPDCGQCRLEGSGGASKCTHQDRLTELLEHAPDGAWIRDPNGAQRTVLQSYSNMLLTGNGLGKAGMQRAACLPVSYHVAPTRLITELQRWSMRAVLCYAMLCGAQAPRSVPPDESFRTCKSHTREGHTPAHLWRCLPMN